MERGPTSKRKRHLDTCLICNEDSFEDFNGNLYRRLLVKYLVPHSNDNNLDLFDGRIFNFCTVCINIIKRLSRLKEDLDAILRKISIEVNTLKTTMILQKSSGNIDIDYFRHMSLRDLRPTVKLERCKVIPRPNQKSAKKPALEIISPKLNNETVSVLYKANLSPRVRMDVNNVLIKRTLKSADNGGENVNSVQSSTKSICDGENNFSKALLKSNLKDSKDSKDDKADDEGIIENEKDKISVSTEDSRSEDSGMATCSEENIIAPEIPRIDVERKEPLSEENIIIENKEYPFLEEIEQYDPWNDPSSAANEIIDPLDVQEERIFNSIARPSEQVNDFETDIDVISRNETTQLEGPRLTENKEKICERPTLTYNYLIVLAIKSSKSNELSTGEIYDFIKDHFPYYRTAKPHWKSLIRKCLTNTQYFWQLPDYDDSSTISGKRDSDLHSRWSVVESQCVAVRNAIILLCEKNQHLMEFPERLEVFVKALFGDKVSSEFSGRDSIAVNSLPLPLDYLSETVHATETQSLDVENNSNVPTCSNSHLDCQNMAVHGVSNELLNKGTCEESEIKVNDNLKVEMKVPHVLDIKPTIKVEDMNEILDNHTTSKIPQIVNSYTCQVAKSPEKKDRGSEQRQATVSPFAISNDPAPQLNNTLNENNTTSKYICPTFSPSQLAILALANSPNSNNTLGTRQIIEFIAENFPYYRTENSWKKCVYETLNTNRCYFKRNFEQGKVGPLISWSIEKVEPHYSQIRLQILSSLKGSLSLNYLAAISYEKLEEIVRKALGSKYDLSFLKNSATATNKQQHLKVTKCKQTSSFLSRNGNGMEAISENLEETPKK